MMGLIGSIEAGRDARRSMGVERCLDLYWRKS
jgi:hypothetical protein